MRFATGLLCTLFLLAACDEPGVCEQKIRQKGVRTGFCIEVEHGGQCPFADSGDGEGEYIFEWHPGDVCEDYGYDVECGEVWVADPSECAAVQQSTGA